VHIFDLEMLSGEEQGTGDEARVMLLQCCQPSCPWCPGNFAYWSLAGQRRCINTSFQVLAFLFFYQQQISNWTSWV